MEPPDSCGGGIVLKSRCTKLFACAGVKHPSGAEPLVFTHACGCLPRHDMPVCEIRNFVGAGRNESQSSSESIMPIGFVFEHARVEITRGSCGDRGAENHAGKSTYTPLCRKRSVLRGDGAPGCGFIHPGAKLEVWKVSERLERSPAACLFWSTLRTPLKTLPVARRWSARC